MEPSLTTLLNNLGKKKENKNRNLYVRLTDTQFFDMEAYCKNNYKNYSEVIREALQAYLNK